MLTKPLNWDSLKTAEGTVCIYKILIGNDVYTSLEDIEDNSLKITRTLFTAQKIIGNTPCFTLECCLRLAGRTIPRGATVQAQVALRNGNTTTDFLPLGTFRVYRRQTFLDGWVKLTCRDSMQIANQDFFQGTVSEDQWPKSMSEVLRSSARQVGIEIDSRTVIQEGDDWIVTPPVGKSIRAVWSAIAAAHAGNFYVTPENKLLLVTPKMESQSTHDLECSEEGYELLGEGVSVDQVLLKINQDMSFCSGTPGVNNIEVDCPYATQGIADYVKSKLSGVLYYPIKVSDIWVDPAMEIHDTCRVLGPTPTRTIWSTLDTSYRLICSAAGSAENVSEPDSEYGFEDTPVSQLKAQSKQIALDAVGSMGQEEILNILTNNGESQGIYIHEGQLYINASCIQSGVLLADLLKAGVLQSADGETFFLDLDNGILRMKATEFLIEGKTVYEIVEESAGGENQEIQSLQESIAQLVVDSDDITETVSKTEKTIDALTGEIESTKQEILEVKSKSDQFSIDLQRVVDDGVDKVTTTTGFTLNEEGLNISKSNSDISTQITEDGMTVNQSGEALLTANHDGVEAKDLHARTYLIIGGRSRFENYGSDRTGCFWIGEN